MDWDKLRIFHAAADAGSFTHAGDQLNMSQSAVSRQVSALERDLNVPLFRRHARGLMLTEQGELLYRTVHDVLNKLSSVQTMLADTKAKPSGELRITTPVGLGSAWLTPRLSEFMELYPDIEIKLLLDDSELDLNMREADVAIWLREPTQPDLIRRPLFTVHLHVYASFQYIRRFGQPASIEEIDRHRIVVFGGQAPFAVGGMNWLATVGRETGKPRRPALVVNNIYGVRQAVRRGIGLAVIPDYLVGEDSDLVQVLPDAELPNFQSFFVYPQAMKQAKRVAVFRDFLVTKARQWKF